MINEFYLLILFSSISQIEAWRFLYRFTFKFSSRLCQVKVKVKAKMSYPELILAK